MTTDDDILIAAESPVGADLAVLMARHTADMHADTPPESIHMMDAGQLDHPDIMFFVMRQAGAPVGMGAFKRIDAVHAEIKSMHVVAEARGDDPIVLVQDYHFALLPAMVRAKLPQATILTFWHIPWPNPESFGICPWRQEILKGLLGSTILGFHTRFHCKNFMETVDRYLEARIEHEHSIVSFHESDTFIESYPISIAWPTDQAMAGKPAPATCRQMLTQQLQLPEGQHIAVGVDRFDYTKGILERLHAVERLLEKRPQWVGKFTFIQVAAPSRSSLEEYREFQQRVHRLADRINTRFGQPGYQPVHLLAEHHEPDQIDIL